ncbi:MAG: S8 family serine peptidase [Candidatus Thalassarchaeaceae archaeon]
MRSAIVVVLLLLSPMNLVGAEEQRYDSIYDENDINIIETYSKSVQNAFYRLSDLTQYEENILMENRDWVVVTSYPLEHQQKIISKSFVSEEFEFLKGTYVWRFEESSNSFDDLRYLFENDDVESFYPLLKRQQEVRYIPNDPDFDEQWHLQNTGQTGGVTGEDVNITSVWDSYNGTGIVISVVDDGLDHEHPDIEGNYNSSYSFDWCNNDPDPSPNSWDAHGTAAGGVAAAVGDNGIDVTGAAFGANLSGSTLIACSTSDQMEANALSFQKNNIDIYTNSWGPADDGQTLTGPGPLTLAALENGVYEGRSGLGNIYTWAAGNGLESNDNANYDGYANSRYTIAVTAINHLGQQSYYAEPGANILVAAHSNGDGEGITTTDNEGSGGYSNGDVTDNFGGTSSATPLAAGVIALILEANINLTWRDVQHIIVQSSRVNDENDSSWEINGAGLQVSHKYGFGVIDAGAAVSLAENWTNVEIESNFSYGPFSPSFGIPDDDSEWSEFSLNVTSDVNIESVDLIADITHTSRGDLDIVLVSPSGKESWLAESRSDNGNGYQDWMFNTVHHWGEEAVGEWKLKIRDTVSSDVGTLNYWEMIIHGVGNYTDTDQDGLSDFIDTDDDGDGWSDIDEDNCGTDSLDMNSTPVDFDNDNICDYLDSDDDGDGWSDIDENNCETNSTNQSSQPNDSDADGICDFVDTDDDGDGWSDIDENSCNTSSNNNNSFPSDYDGDGLCDFVDTDDDGDGLSDINETEIYETDPLNPDMDGDGLTDYEEIILYNTKADVSDTDVDGLTDYEEVIIYGTDPLSPDSDDDGLTDIEELNTWETNPNVADLDNDEDTFYHFQDCDDNNSAINPSMEELLNGVDDNCDILIDEGYNQSDLDGDGLIDWEEYHIYGTDFNNSDSDEDGLSDYEELLIYETNPLTFDKDEDFDGWYWFEDCDDNNPYRFPDMVEILDNVDNDCDELIDEDFLLLDSDSDGLNDFEEYHNYSTDPLNGDSDGDGLPDGMEVDSLNSNPMEKDLDSDADGWYEFQDCDDEDFERAPDKPEVLDNKDNDCDNLIDEDFWSLDSDYDGISDYSEFHNYTTNHLDNDSDDDGIEDGVEILQKFSNPLKYDYDKDSDGYYEFEDCDDLVFRVNSGAAETWNGVDDNCNNEIDENITRLDFIITNPQYDQSYSWDSGNKSLIISIQGIPSNIERTIIWKFEGFSVTENTSSDNLRLFLPPLDCNSKYRTALDTHLCLEGNKNQNISVVITDLGIETELTWEIDTEVWIRNSKEDVSITSFLGTTQGVLGMIIFIVMVSLIGVLIGVRINNNKNLKDAFEAFEVPLTSNAIGKNITLPPAPELSELFYDDNRNN